MSATAYLSPPLPSFLLLCADAAEVKKEANYIVRKKIHCLPYVYVQCVFFPPFIAAFKNHSRVKRQISVKCSRSQSQTEGEGSNRSAGEDGGGNARCRSLYTSTGNSRCLSILRATVFNWGCSCYRQYGRGGGAEKVGGKAACLCLAALRIRRVLTALRSQANKLQLVNCLVSLTFCCTCCSPCCCCCCCC